VRLIVRCDIQRVPVEVLFESEELDPSWACEILRSCLGKIDTWLDRITFEKVDERGDRPSTPNPADTGLGFTGFGRLVLDLELTL